MTKKNQLIEKIKKFGNKYFNEDQKTIAIAILERVPEEQVQTYADFIFMKRRTGFAFDYSPEIAKGRIITLREDKKRRINVGNSVSQDENKLIIGDNYNALKSLLVTHQNKIDLIYIDPPYNTETAKRDGNHSSKDPINGGGGHKFLYKDKFGRGGWLNMMKVRLKLAKDLLTPEGVIFCSIDDTEQAYLKILMDEIFYEKNFVATVIWNKTSQGTTLGNGFKRTHEFIHIFQKSSEFKIKLEKIKNISKYKLVDAIGKYALSNKLNSINSYLSQNKKRGYTIYYNQKIEDIKIRYEYDIETLVYTDKFDEKLISKEYIPIRPGIRKGRQTVWNWGVERLKKDWLNEIIFKKNSKGELFPYHKNRIKKTRNPLTIQKFDSRKNGVGVLDSIFNRNVFNFPKPVDLVKWIIDRHSKKNLNVLDFFAGSGTTGHAVLELNREDGGNRAFILVTNNENNIAYDVTFERLYKIIKGRSYKEKNSDNIEWIKKNKPFENAQLRVINIDDSVQISLKENVSEEVYQNCKKGLQLLDGQYKKKNLNLYYDLAALNPLESEEDQF